MGNSSASTKAGVSLCSVGDCNVSCGIWSLSLQDLDSGELLDLALAWVGAPKTRGDICKHDKMKVIL